MYFMFNSSNSIVAAMLVILCILFLTTFVLALIAAVVAKSVILGILLLALFISELWVVLVTKLLISSILFSIYLILTLC